MRRFIGLALASLLLIALPGGAAETSLHIDHAWARATAPGASAAAAYLRIANPAGRPADTLLGATAAVAAKTELHVHQEDQGVMRMRSVVSIPIPPGQAVEARPGGLHVMLIGLAKPLVAGQEFKLTLHFEHAGNIPVPIKVEPIDFEPGDEHHHH